MHKKPCPLSKLTQVPPLLHGSLVHSLSSVQLPSSVETQPAGHLRLRKIESREIESRESLKEVVSG